MVAPNPISSTNIRFPQSPFLDPTTGRPAREWIIWLQSPDILSATIAYIVITGGVISGVTINNVTINNSIINDTTIGLTTPAAGKFTDLTALNGIGGGTF
jgi:hypothetical protein